MRMFFRVFPKRFLRDHSLGSWGHTDSRVHCRLAACRLIDWVKSSNFISWLLYNRNAFLRRLVKRSIRVVKVLLLYRLCESCISFPMLLQTVESNWFFHAMVYLEFVCCWHTRGNLILFFGWLTQAVWKYSLRLFTLVQRCNSELFFYATTLLV